MPKRKIEWTEEKIQRYIKEGRGTGEGSDYKPWITVQDFPSSGRVSRVKGWKSKKRFQHFMSDHETRYLYLLDWAEDVIDIREQYPILEREVTLEIAQRKGIRHPCYLQTPIVLTTDFLVIVYRDNKMKYLARTVKPALELENSRVIEKFEIEKEYWSSKKIDWAIVTPNEISKSFAKNIEWVHSSYWLEEFPDLEKDDLYELMRVILARWKASDCKLLSFTNSLDEEYKVECGTFLYLVKHLMANKIIKFDMYNKNITRLPLKDFTINQDGFLKEKIAT
jgi:hypothetical protein